VWRAAGRGRFEGRTNNSQLNGVYRYEITDEHLRQAGVTDGDDFANNHGDYCWEQRGPNPEANGEDCLTYEVDGDLITFNYPEGPEVYRWRKLPSGDLKLTFVSSAAPGEENVAAALAIPVWKRIADAE
jgi:hypothetical protein